MGAGSAAVISGAHECWKKSVPGWTTARSGSREWLGHWSGLTCYAPGKVDRPIFKTYRDTVDLTGIAVIPTGPRYMPYGWVFVVAVVALILLIFIRVYVIGDRSRRRTGHRSG